MTKKDKKILENSIQIEGFDYCFLDYSDFLEIKDEKFHKILNNFKASHEALKNYLEEQGIDIGSEE